MYEEHKKGVPAITKPSEVQNTNRPVSRYQRDKLASAGIRKEQDEFEKETEREDNQILQSFVTRFNKFLKENKISKEDFMDNPKLFLSFDDFKEMFTNIKFDLLSNEPGVILKFKNPSFQEGYIRGQTFYDNFPELNWNKEQNHEEEETKKIETCLTSHRDNKDIEREFRSFQNDILDIVEKEKRSQSSYRIKSNVPSASNIKKSNPSVTPFKRPVTTSENAKKDVPMSHRNINTAKPRKSQNTKVYLLQTLKRKKAEEDLMRLAIIKRNKEHDKEIIRKMMRANEMAEILKTNKSYSAYTEENDGSLICRVYDKLLKLTKDIGVKQFLFEYIRMKKIIEVEDERKMYKETIKDNHKQGESNFLKKSRKERHMEIKQVLKDSIELKLLLKKQLKALRDKKLLDINLINSNLRLTNLDDDAII